MPLGRPIEFNPDHVVNAAMQAFWSKGYEATSLTDLLAATGLSKSSFYQSFGGKQQMFGRCITTYVDQMVGKFQSQLADEASPLAFVRATLTAIASEGADTRSPLGCLVMNTASEFGRRDPAFSGWVDDGMARVGTVMEAALARAQALGEVAATQPPAVQAAYVMSSIAGLRTMVKAGTPLPMMLSVVDMVTASLRR
ncbi:MAG: TetR/AcrR family transcriptional regulator [Betaproteobacteria bacterium HGW-Betaproteobacteria-3]|jgi:TetR/AcrR family transcriptional repressor of nem operon|nr:MAG: TetR/AcrR family transcriptional regulator [Betaproteobacteria bacterium HGW-Betaproteobacteria-3]